MKKQVTVEDMNLNEVTIKLGRPVNPNSARQARLAAKAAVNVETAVKELIG